MALVALVIVCVERRGLSRCLVSGGACDTDSGSEQGEYGDLDAFCGSSHNQKEPGSAERVDEPRKEGE